MKRPEVNTACGFSCTVHANSAREALAALVNAAIMAGENVGEGIVRRVFASALDLVVHCELNEGAGSAGATGAGTAGITRQVTEIVAVVPSLTDDFSTEPIFTRAGLGAPLEWTGALPAAADVIARALPERVSLSDLLEGRVDLR